MADRSSPAAVQVQFAVDAEEAGDAIAEALLAERLAACVQRVGPVRSRYRWQGRLETAEEWLYLCKTTAALAPAATSRIEALHPYDTPEVVVVPLMGGLDRYLDWLAAETGPDAGEQRAGPAAAT